MNQQYLKGALWFISHVLISSINDSISVFLGSGLPSFEIVTLRFAFSALTLFIIMLPRGISAFKTNHVILHFFRGLLLFIGIAIWVTCLNKVPVVMVTLMSFTIPIFFIILAYFFLKEKIGLKKVAITLFGFVGILIVLNPSQDSFHPVSLLLILAVICFASLDILNKKYVSDETITNMLFYSALFTLLFSLIPTIMGGWVWPNQKEIILCFILGAGANLILYTILKAFSFADATSLSPLRYCELIFSAIIAYFLFDQVPSNSLYIAALIIIPCNILLLKGNK
jgi:S-adenosylmethionine uptake transporter